MDIIVHYIFSYYILIILPSQEAKRCDWVAQIKAYQECQGTNFYICENHFSSNCLLVKNGRKVLKEGSIPTIFTSPNSSSSSQGSAETVSSLNIERSIRDENESLKTELKTLKSEFIEERMKHDVEKKSWGAKMQLLSSKLTKRKEVIDDLEAKLKQQKRENKELIQRIKKLPHLNSEFCSFLNVNTYIFVFLNCYGIYI